MIVAGPAEADQRRALAAIAEAFRSRGAVVLAADAAPADPVEPRPGVTLFTSGTTGAPKPVHRPWDELEAEVAATGGAADRFLLTYNVARYAGLQVALHCLVHGSALLVPERVDDVEAVIAAGADATHLSATPSLLRRIVMAGGAERLTGLRQLTLGGEYATQAVLDLAAHCWPGARVTSIYASSEAGASFAASDGLEGFPAEVLSHGRAGRTGRLETDGELVVTLAGGREVRTGDRWALEDGRLLFRGRREDVVNVGGYKVSPAKVERVLLGVPGVEDCRVYGRPSPVTGQVVVAELVGEFDLAAVRAACREELERAEVPGLFRRVESVPLSAAGKAVR
jgi:acyl-coenzyme A synthetase/AMP-(fatty) acid ligase